MRERKESQFMLQVIHANTSDGSKTHRTILFSWVLSACT